MIKESYYILQQVEVMKFEKMQDMRSFTLCLLCDVEPRSVLDLLTVGPKFTRPACRAAAAAVDRYLLPAPNLSSKLAGRCRWMGRTDGRTLDRFLTLAA